jgi:uncharacterized protein
MTYKHSEAMLCVYLHTATMDYRFVNRISQALLSILILCWSIVFELHGQDTLATNTAITTLATDWSGVLEAGKTQLKLGVHFKLDSKGKWTGTMDSPDQGAFGIPMDSVSLEGNKLEFEIKRVQAKFAGNVSVDLASIEGNWTQGISVKVKMQIDKNYKRPMIMVKDTFEGDWNGSISVGKSSLAMILHFRQDASGKWMGSMDSPDQGAFGISIDKITVEGKKISGEIKSASSSFIATLSEDAQELTGTWTQGDELSFELKRSAVTLAPPNRPQTPIGPFPYRSEEVTFENRSANIQLAGTLTLPEGEGPYPAVILITGSGPQNRDEEIAGHRIFFVIADYLTRKGFAVLRYDDRGVGASTGVFDESTTVEFVDDAISALEFLQGRSDIYAGRVGLLGHSEGGIIAPIVEVKSGKVAFLVLMAAPGVNGEQVLYEQAKRIIAANGGSKDLIAENRLVQEELFQIVKTESDRTFAASRLKELTEKKVAMHKDEGWSTEKIDAWKMGFVSECNQVNSPWFRKFLTLDPSDWLKRVKAPVLAINGELDTQVIPDQNLPAIESALIQGGNSSYILKRLSELNHQLQKCKTGSPSEYHEIEETISTSALETISDWLISSAHQWNKP